MANRRMRADKKKSLDKVAAAAVNNPLATERELAKEAWVSHGTVHNVKNELGQAFAKDPRIISVTDADMEILTLAQWEILRRMKVPEEKEKMRTGEISQVAKESAARYTIFRGSVTDSSGGMKDVDAIRSMTPKQIADYIKNAVSGQ